MTRQRSDAPANRRLLLEAARRIFAERGLAAEVKEIAAEAGVGIGTFYRNFPSKDDLVLALLEEMKDTVDQILKEAEEGEAGTVESIEVLLRRGFELTQRYGWLLEAMWMGQLPEGWHANHQPPEHHKSFENLIQRGIDEGLFRADLEPDVAGGMLFGPLILRREPFKGSPEEAAARLVQLFLEGAKRQEA